ncbi:MAG: Rrf2 family transcriptional regulator [Burkholderiales bacterium]|nr:MAG: Rrf2 family transcriptional regulator [Burkholderiales bacterium]
MSTRASRRASRAPSAVASVGRERMTSWTSGRSVGSWSAARRASERRVSQTLSRSATFPAHSLNGFLLAATTPACWDLLMKISQKLEYACRALTQLAKSHDGRTLTRLEDLAQREAISGSFLVQILNDLRRAGLVDSRRGKAGGYLLARDPGQINLRQIVEAVDPALLQCSVSQDGESGRAIRRAWQQISATFCSSLEHVTLETLSASQAAPMFYI